MLLDAIELEIISSRLEEAVLTMENQLFHSGYSPILRESFDGSAAILDRNGCVVKGAGAPIHLFPYYHTVKAVIRVAGSRMRPGDSYLLNDPYVGGNLHVPDTAIVTPFFHGGELRGFAASIAHKPDMGGQVLGSSGAGSREIYHEGIMFPGVRFWSEAGIEPDIEALLRTNTRSSVETIGDLRSQVGCTRVGCARLAELFDHYGAEQMTEAFESLIRASEKRIRHALSQWPDGTAEAEGWLDHDGVQVGKRIAIRVRVEKRGNAISIDFGNSDAGVAGPVNLRPQATETSAALALLSMLDPSIAINDGARRVIEIVNPPGTVMHATKPQPINNYYPTMHLGYCVVQTALSRLVPEAACAPAGLGVGGVLFGFDAADADRQLIQYELLAPSLGASAKSDGAFIALPLMQFTPSQPIEILETEYPIEVVAFEPLIDSAGAGGTRGGSGYVREYRLLADATFTIRMGQFENGAWGVAGGQAPNGASCTLNPGAETEEALPILATRRLSKGDRIRIVVAGGGGFGEPSSREAEQVAADVRDKLVSAQAARDVYEVVLDATGREVDSDATASLRGATPRERLQGAAGHPR